MRSFVSRRRRNRAATPPARTAELGQTTELARTARRRTGWLAAAVVAVLERPTVVPVALAGFLVRGGIVVLLLPIVVLPTPVGLATIFGPDIVSVALAGPNPGIIRLALGGAVLLGIWLLVAGLLGAAADVAGIEAVAENLAAAGPAGLGRRSRLRAVARVAVVRWLAHLPLVVALGWGVVRIIEATYNELVLPADTVTPLVLRILVRTPDAVVAVVGTWLVGEAWGGWAARFVVLEDRSSAAALAAAIRWFVGAPLRGLTTVVAADALLGVGLAGSAAAAARVWSVLRPIVRADPGGLGMVGAVLLLVVVWLVGLVVVGLAVAWRAVAWTLVLAAPERRTGGSTARGVALPPLGR